MGKGKKSLKIKAGEITYKMPTLDKKMLQFKKSLGEVSAIINGKKK